MGWYGDQCTRKQKVEHLLEPFNGQRCLRHCYRGNAYKGVLWSVWESPAGNYIRCDLLHYRDGMWMHKPMDESMGPFFYSCPLSYLKMAPVADPTWRECVVAYHNTRKEKRRAIRSVSV
jgi:hypothetical protein